MHYSIKYLGITIQDFTANNDREAKKMADAMFTHYEDLICVDDNFRSLGGKPETEQTSN